MVQRQRLFQLFRQRSTRCQRKRCRPQLRNFIRKFFKFSYRWSSDSDYFNSSDNTL